MQALINNYGAAAPENLVHRLAAQLRSHALWDAMLIFFPPVVAVIYVVIHFYRAMWIGPTAFCVISLLATGLGVLAVLLRYRPLIPSVGSAARIVDERYGAQDRFLTLTTLDPPESAAALVSRLRIEAAGYQNQIELKRDFRYQIKRSFYWSLFGSIVAAVLFHWMLPVAQSILHPVSAHERLRELAEKMTEGPRLSELGRGLQALASRIEDPKVSPQERQSAIEEMQQKLEAQQKKEERKDNRELLGQAASTLQNLEQQSGTGQNQQKDQDQGGGGIQSNLPQQGQGGSEQSQRSGGGQKGDVNAQLDKEMGQGDLAQGAPQDQSKENNQQKSGDGKGTQPDPNKPDKNQGKEESAGKTEGGSAESGGKSKASEDIPRGAPPAERFNPGGQEGKEGIKGAGYVTVQLPEEIAADSKGQSAGVREGRGRKVAPKGPVSNVPLPAHVPDAPMEKQQMPLEYRGMIR
jgi:hypothetical protein